MGGEIRCGCADHSMVRKKLIESTIEIIFMKIFGTDSQAISSTDLYAMSPRLRLAGAMPRGLP